MSVQRALALRVVPALVVLATATARGQSISVDPYDPWNAIYRPFVFPTAPPNPAMPNQGRLDVIGGPTAYGRYLDSVGVAGTADPFGRVGRPGGRFTPYYQAYRQLGGTDRSYRPNASDTFYEDHKDTFYEDQQKRQRALTDAQKIRDPKRRASELRRLQREGVEAARTGDSVRGGRRPASRAPAPAAAPPPATPPAAPTATRPTSPVPSSRGLLGSDPVTRELLTPSSNARGRAMERRRPSVTVPAGEAAEPTTPR